jgi:uncharacterized membrane protein
MKKPRWINGQSKLDSLIIGLLVAGVMVSILLEVTGMALFWHYHGRPTVSGETAVFIQGSNPGFFLEYVSTMIAGQGVDIFLMTLGILVLILTPFMRLVVSIVYFAVERDAKFFVITLCVLIVLIASIALH